MATAVLAAGQVRRTSRVSEDAIRGTAAWLLVLFALMGGLGLQWDEAWHRSVGRDQFWTPPHILLYSSTALVGLTCLVVVLWDSWRHRAGTEVNDGNTVRVLGFVHAPLGFVVAGLGALLTALAAPLDNYWHELYGIDVALWAPFHMMGALGGAIAHFGGIFIWASLLTGAKRRGAASEVRWYSVGLLWTIGSTVQMSLALSAPGLINFTMLVVGPLRLMTYPILLAAGVTFGYILLKRLLPLAGSATFMAGLLLLLAFLQDLFVPWAVHTSVAQQGLSFRSPAVEPRFNLAALEFQLALLILALVVDAAPWFAQALSRRQLSIDGTVLGLLAWILGTGASLAVFRGGPARLAEIATIPGRIPQPPTYAAMLLALLICLVIAALCAQLAGGTAEVLSRSTR
ncbi:MAG: hypothetical protein JOZ39_04045 [Chloroflexi bacterium]|nr:hypothetical protein [Chloroflexota bacterium]